MRDVDLIMVGSGSLAHAVLMSLAGCGDTPMDVIVAARNETAVRHMATLANALGGASTGRLVATPVVCDYSAESMGRLFDAYRPRIVLTLASMQSPWAMTRRWRELVARLGYGCTLPLQAALADRVMRAATAAHPGAHLLNGCYPDLTNHVLAARGIPVAGGIGNIAIVASMLRIRTGHTPLSLLAHHAHVSAMIRGAWDGLPAPAVWLEGRRLPEHEAAALTTPVRLPADDTLNRLTGALAAPMLLALSGRGNAWQGHVPGLHGRPGGYPVRADAIDLHLALPPGMTPERAEQLNSSYALHDGVTVEDGRYVLTRSLDDAERALEIRLPAALAAWRADALDEQVALLVRLRAIIDATEVSVG
ncbi:hypothetical protein FPJ27_15555 [Burkholderia sp. MS455]|uniref:hypothetical protein n=1 Tax=Burkholderia sp. MS455 TaxID=2811788 RepID=UPI0019567847|nr:hypothetical protein [Burkholderia sp. MS455]QRR07677.1 hypothetical protein FPJ27_15555 [Burkholderia sp. MS455]